MTPDDLRNRFAYHKPDNDKVVAHETVRKLMHDVAVAVNDLVPAGREQSLAVTHLEDAMMWANAGIARA